MTDRKPEQRFSDRVIKHFGIEGTKIAEVPCRILGPIPTWGAEIVINPAYLETFEDRLRAIADQYQHGIAGYFMQSQGNLIFHISRLPRHIGEPVPSGTQFAKVVQALHDSIPLKEWPLLIFNPEPKQGERFVLGLEEGYSEGENTVCHKPDEVRQRLQENGDLEFIDASIFSYRPGFETYREPACVVINSGDRTALNAVTEVANAMRQARFSYEDFSAGQSSNVEIMEHALVTSAQSRTSIRPTTLSLTPAELRDILLGSTPPSEKLEAAYREGRLTSISELLRLRGVPQDPEWHREGDGWTHVLMVVDEAWELARKNAHLLTADQQYALVLGALCHDFGKALTTQLRDTKKGRRWTSWNHEERGVEPAKEFLERYGIDGTIAATVLDIVRHHMEPIRIFNKLRKQEINEKGYAKEIQRFVSKLKDGWEVFLLAVEADQRGRICEGSTDPVLAWQTAFTEAIESEGAKLPARPTPPQSLVNGDELMHAIEGLSPGPFMGILMRAIQEAKSKGDISNKDDAIEFARRLFDSQK